MTRDQLVARLRTLNEDRIRLERLEQAMEALEPDERDIIGTMYVAPEAYAVLNLCEKLDIERSSVYRRRDKALQKLCRAMGELRDKSGTTF